GSSELLGLSEAGSATGRTDEVEAADGVDPGLRLPVGGGGGGDAVGLGPGEDRQGGVVDVAQAVLGPLPGVAPQLLGDVDDPAGVHAVVGGVEDAGLGQRLVAARFGQLVVGAAADGGAAQLGDRLERQARPQGAGGVDVALDGVDLLHSHHLDAEVVDDPL